MNSIAGVRKPTNGFLFLSNDYNVESLKNYVETLTEQDWLEDGERQRIFRSHRDTYSIKVQWIPLEVTFFDRSRVEYHSPIYQDITVILKPLLDFLCEYYNGEVFKILLTRLSPKSEILPHRDNGFSLMMTHRVHIPVKTNEHVTFNCSGFMLNMKEGHVVEINNSTLHSVKNDSDQDRIHLIVDIIEK